MSLLTTTRQNRTVAPLGSAAPDAINLGRLLSAGGIAGKMLYGGPLHTLVFGPNGAGKSTRLLLPNLLEIEKRSIVVIDPKGELAAISAPFRRTVGEVVIINPFGVLVDHPGYEDLRSNGFNPLLALDPSAPSFNADASLLAEALVTVNEGSGKHFDSSARSLVAAIIMYVVITAPTLGRVPTLAMVRELLSLASEPPSKRNGFQAKGIPALALEMMKSSIRGLRNKAAQFENWSEEIASVASTARDQTEPFDDEEIADDLSRGSFDMRELKRRPVTVYLILPPEMIERHSKWLRLVISSALRGVMRHREPHEPRVLFALDEFAALGHLKIIETVWALVRGYGIQIMPILQDLNQLKELYRDRWETFVGMAGAVVAFGARDMTTATWMSQRAGERTELAASYNSGTGTNPKGEASSSEGISYQQIKVPLLVPHQFFALRDGCMFLWLARVADTIPAYAPAYYQVDKLLARARRNPYFHG